MTNNNRSAAPTELDWMVEARHDAGAGPVAIARELAITPAAVNTRLEKMKRYRRGERLLAEDPESLEGLKYVGAIPWAAARAVGAYYAERLSELCDWSAAELLGCPGIGGKAVETIKAVMAARGLELHPDRTEAIHRRSKFRDLYEQQCESRPVTLASSNPQALPVTGREDNIVHVDFRRPPVE